MFISPYPLVLTPTERQELTAMARSRTIAAGLAQRARVILGVADGEPYAVLSARLELSTTTLTRMPRAPDAGIGSPRRSKPRSWRSRSNGLRRR